MTYHGRDFQHESLRREVHLVPVDDASGIALECVGQETDRPQQDELDRLEEQHRVLTHQIFRDLPNPLFLAAVREPNRVLDCGYGSGAWVVAVAESYPDCEVSCLVCYRDREC